MRIPGLKGMAPLELLKKAVTDFKDDDMSTYAAALSYQILFALFPFLIFLVSLLGVLNLQSFFDWLLGQGKDVLPGDAFGRFEEVITQIQNEERGGLLSIGIIAAIWAASGGVRSVMNALNRAYDAEEIRSAKRRYLLSILFTIGLAVMMISAAALMLLGPQAVEWLAGQIGLGDAFVTLWTWLRIPAALVILTLAIALVYYVAPCVDQPFGFITPGSVVAVVVWLLASLGFSFYVSNMGNYTATYGSLGSVIILLLFFYISSAALLLGAEINAVLFHLHENEPDVPRNGRTS